MRFGVQAVMIAQPGKGDELSRIMLCASRLVANLEGSLIYIVQLSKEDEDKVLITEVWSSQANHQASLTN
jgi:quinol monooxygenase YgiN